MVGMVGGRIGWALESEGLENPWFTTETMTGPSCSHPASFPPPSSRAPSSERTVATVLAAEKPTLWFDFSCPPTCRESCTALTQRPPPWKPRQRKSEASAPLAAPRHAHELEATSAAPYSSEHWDLSCNCFQGKKLPGGSTISPEHPIFYGAIVIPFQRDSKSVDLREASKISTGLKHLCHSVIPTWLSALEPCSFTFFRPPGNWSSSSSQPPRMLHL